MFVNIQIDHRILADQYMVGRSERYHGSIEKISIFTDIVSLIPLRDEKIHYINTNYGQLNILSHRSTHGNNTMKTLLTDKSSVIRLEEPIPILIAKALASSGFVKYNFHNYRIEREFRKRKPIGSKDFRDVGTFRFMLSPGTILECSGKLYGTETYEFIDGIFVQKILRGPSMLTILSCAHDGNDFLRVYSRIIADGGKPYIKSVGHGSTTLRMINGTNDIVIQN